MENKFKPYDKVLVRDHDRDKWRANLYSHFNNETLKYVCACFGTCWAQCIPYEGNENLLGTTNSPEPKRWRAEKGGLYYRIMTTGKVTTDIDHNAFIDKACYEAGNYYRTKQEAEAAAERVRKAYKGE